MSDPAVRPARRPDVPRLSATLARAWADYRWSAWALPEDGRAQRLHRWCELAVLRGLDTGSVWTTDDGACVAVWAPPSPPPVAEDLQVVLDRDLPRMLGSRQPVVLASERLAEQGLPDEPHWRLVALGTLADRRHAGLAAQVCRPVLERCDAEGVPAALTAYTRLAVTWAQRQGFAVTHATRTAVDHELPAWAMVRRPATGSGGGEGRVDG